MTIAEILIYSSAIWRISSLFVNEEGPGGIFRIIREKVGITHDENGALLMVPETFLAGVFSCVWCCSIWVSVFFTVFYFMAGELSLKIAIPFALSGLSIVLDRLVQR